MEQSASAPLAACATPAEERTDKRRRRDEGTPAEGWASPDGELEALREKKRLCKERLHVLSQQQSELKKELQQLSTAEFAALRDASGPHEQETICGDLDDLVDDVGEIGQEEAPAAALGGSDRPVIVDAVGAKTALVSRARDMEHFQSFLFA